MCWKETSKCRQFRDGRCQGLAMGEGFSCAPSFHQEILPGLGKGDHPPLHPWLCPQEMPLRIPMAHSQSSHFPSPHLHMAGQTREEAKEAPTAPYLPSLQLLWTKLSSRHRDQRWAYGSPWTSMADGAAPAPTQQPTPLPPSTQVAIENPRRCHREGIQSCYLPHPTAFK